ncbi:autotransporter outer membrane beta-barrel domain-containing protein [Mixta intestinalis]|uniref:Outer membrane protein IcsA autotransporter n=1 Tax=Mixta intestinalis TaxID=1615494 RepID=A0A6P1PXA3_9GAMM|nr:autotransporter outer membrane beta-barrel domain-containing protein [Mixta intestinalis]QHM70742.1 Outer membrane protein IcsA autotransporter [Mixta intestinalis]
MKKRVNPVPLTILATVIHSTLAHASISDNLFDPDNWRANIIYNGSGDLSLSYMTLNSASEDKPTAGILYYDKSNSSVGNNIKLHDINIKTSNLKLYDDSEYHDNYQDYLAYGVINGSDLKDKNLSISVTGNSLVEIESKVLNRFVNGYQDLSAGLAVLNEGKGNTTITTGNNVKILIKSGGGTGIFSNIGYGIESIINNGVIISGAGLISNGITLAGPSKNRISCKEQDCYSYIGNDGLIDVSGMTSSAILVKNTGDKNIFIENKGSIIARNEASGIKSDWANYYPESGEVSIINDGTIMVESGGKGIVSYLSKNKITTITNNGVILDNIDAARRWGHVVGISYESDTSSSQASIVNNGKVLINQGGFAIQAESGGNVEIVNDGEISSQQSDFAAIYLYKLKQDGFSSVKNNNLIRTNGNTSHGIYYKGREGYAYGDFLIENKGSIYTSGDSSDGVKLTLSAINYDVKNEGEIIAIGDGASAINIDDFAGRTSIDMAWMNIHLGDKSEVIGGLKDGAGIKIINGRYALAENDSYFSISNSGAISALNNQAITVTNVQHESIGKPWEPVDGVNYADVLTKISPYVYNRIWFNLQNAGIITGNISVSAVGTKFYNLKNGVFELESINALGKQQQAWMDFYPNATHEINSIDENEDWSYIRATEGYSTFQNYGTIRFSDNMRDSSDGIFRGLNYFYAEADSVIDLTTNNPASANGFGRNNVGAGDVLRITGATYFFPDKKTEYKSGGGILRLNTDLTTASAANVFDRLTDRLVVDRTQLSHGLPTWIDIVPTARSRLQAKQTAGDGFLLVQVNDKKYSSKDAFRLLHPVVASKYEYILGIKEGDWYLTSSCTGGMTCYGSNEKKLYNPATGAWLANQAAMTAMMSHSLADRQSSPAQAGSMTNGLTRKLATSQNIAKKAQAFAMLNNLAWQQDALYSPVWVQYSGSTRYSNPVFGTLNNKTRSDVMRIGGDLKRTQWLSGDVHLGFMNTMGNSRADIASRATGTKARGEVSGYSSGLYGTWFSDAESGHGLYTDVWVQAGYFTSEIKGQAQASEKYHSRIVSSSVESGYTFAFNGGNLEDGGFTVTPQAQLTYHRLSAGNVRDSNGMEVSAGSKGGAVSRVGLRVASGKKEALPGKNVRLNAFVESHFVRSGLNNSLDFDGAALADNQAKNSLESKFGVQLKVGERAELNSTLNHQLRKGDRDNYGAYAGLTLRF